MNDVSRGLLNVKESDDMCARNEGIMHIHYLAHYAYGKDINEYNVAVPARRKMDYILYALEQAGYYVDVFSVATSKNKVIQRSKVVRISEQTTIRYSTCLKRANKVFAVFSSLFRFVQIFAYILLRIPSGGTLLVYHSNSFIKPIRFARRLKKIRLVIDVEEVYSELFKCNHRVEQMEKSFLLSGDAYIVVNDVLARRFQAQGKPVVVAYGDYRMNYISGVSWNDDKSHIVYAGTIEENKLGAFTAVETARFLSEDYVVHIIGFGNEDSVLKLKAIIDGINSEKGYTAVSYDGFLSGKELDEYLSRCDIGLSTYILSDSFANNSFPSKLMSYVAHNLKVVTGDAKAFRNAKVSSNWSFYKEYSPASIAEVISECEKGVKHSNEMIVNELNQDFIRSLRKVF